MEWLKKKSKVFKIQVLPRLFSWPIQSISNLQIYYTSESGWKGQAMDKWNQDCLGYKEMKIASHSLVESFRLKGAGKDCLFHTSNTEKLRERGEEESDSPGSKIPTGKPLDSCAFWGMSRIYAASHREFYNSCSLFSSFCFLIFLFTDSHGYQENPHCCQGIPSFKKVCYSITEEYQVASSWFIFDKSMLPVTHELVLQDCHKQNITLIITQWLTIQRCYEHHEIKEECFLKFPFIHILNSQYKGSKQHRIKKKSFLVLQHVLRIFNKIQSYL